MTFDKTPCGKPITLGSLFAGIGGFDLAAERTGFEVRWSVESDGHCHKVLNRHFPNAALSASRLEGVPT